MQPRRRDSPDSCCLITSGTVFRYAPSATDLTKMRGGAIGHPLHSSCLCLHPHPRCDLPFTTGNRLLPTHPTLPSVERTAPLLLCISICGQSLQYSFDWLHDLFFGPAARPQQYTLVAIPGFNSCGRPTRKFVNFAGAMECRHSIHPHKDSAMYTHFKGVIASVNVFFFNETAQPAFPFCLAQSPGPHMVVPCPLPRKSSSLTALVSMEVMPHLVSLSQRTHLESKSAPLKIVILALHKTRHQYPVPAIQSAKFKLL